MDRTISTAREGRAAESSGATQGRAPALAPPITRRAGVLETLVSLAAVAPLLDVVEMLGRLEEDVDHCSGDVVVNLKKPRSKSRAVDCRPVGW
jgi:CTP:molybdopterin cytidylyltransferase MocA